MPFKVLHIFDHSLPVYTGYTFRSKNILACQRNIGIRVVGVTSLKHNLALQKMKMQDKETVEGFDFYRCSTSFDFLYHIPLFSNVFIMFNLWFRLIQIVRQEKPDVIHAHSPFLNLLPALMIKLYAKIPVCYEIRAFWEDAAVDHGTLKEGSVLYKFYQWMETSLLRFADKVFPISQGLKDELLKRGVSKEKIQIIPNAVSYEELTAMDNYKQAMPKKNKVTFGFIGSLYGYEGLDIGLRAFKKFTHDNPKVKSNFLIAGTGPEYEKLRKMVLDLDLCDQVQLMGRVSHDQIESVYDQIDILLFPRKRMRLTDIVTPLKPLEAMLYGKIVIASNVGGHLELLEDHKRGYLFEADQSHDLCRVMKFAIQDQASWKDHRKSGTELLMTVRNWSVNSQLYEQCYSQFV